MQAIVLIRMVQEAIRVGLLLAGGPILAALLVGLVVALFQTMTQMNEPTTGFIARMLSIGLVVFVLLPWLLSKWIAYATLTITSLPLLI